MRLFDTRAEFDNILGGTKKWSRTGEALDEASTLQEGVAYSIGDSLTYVADDVSALATESLVGRRRYHLVVASTRGTVRLEVARKGDLEEASGYDNTTDRQLFSGSGEVVSIPEGGICIVDIDEAARILPDAEVAAVQLHVSVEGATFHNK
ncbi:MAG: hypothetical protein ABIS84_02115 [Arachnia sp.]